MKEQQKSKSVFLFAFQNVIDKRSYIKFYKFTNRNFNFQFEKETMFADSIQSLVEINPENDIYAIVFGSPNSGFAIAKADFATYKLEVLSFNLQRSGIKIMTVVPLDHENYVLVYGERQV